MIRLVLYIILFYGGIAFAIFYNKWDTLRSQQFLNKVEFYRRAINYSPEFYAVNNLNFVPARDYRGKPIFYHDTIVNYFNNAGYRGDIIPIQKDSEKVRILFLGGSTTVQEGDSTIESTYPETVKTILNKDSRKNKYFEILNGGLDGANSFDILNAYLYKYKYYHSDFLVIHSGFNDCSWYIDSLAYSPDYTHLNMSISVDDVSKPLLLFLSFLMKFKLTSWLVINYIEKVHYSGSKRLKEAQELRNVYPYWLNISPDSALKDIRFNAFYNNIKTLVENARLNHTNPILMQMPYPKNHEYYKGIYGQALNAHNDFLILISKELQVPIIELSDMNIPDSCFKDIIHVNTKGNYLKALAVSKKIVEIVQD